MKTKLFPFALFALVVGAALPVSSIWAATGTLQSTVTRTLVSSAHFGGCMASFASLVSSASPPVNCPGYSVSFSCTGTYVAKDLAFAMLDQAQLAVALNKPVSVTIDDTLKHNGQCVATRIDVIN